MGKAVTDWRLLSKEQIDLAVQKAVKTNLEKGFSFLFLRCGGIFQVLSFPPVLKKVDGGKKRTKINLNVILLDSISRPHFYRILPRAVEALQNISHDPKIKATTLDFELVQSTGQQTFENLRPIFCGVVVDDNKVTASAKNTKASLGVEVLYGTFKKWGYQTFFQEDLCWYDEWGSVLTDIEKRAVPQWNFEFRESFCLMTLALAPRANSTGYGNCERLVGKSFSKGIKRNRGEFIVTSMDIHVFPPTGYNEDEVFRVSVKQFAQPKDGVFFLNSIRVSTYSKFAHCADKSVDIKLCACAKTQTSDVAKKGLLFENGVPSRMFDSKTAVKNLDSNCLLFLRRDHGSLSFALEVANVCSNATYEFTMTGSTDQRVFTNTLPISLELPPKTCHFLTSVSKYIVKVDTDLNLKASIQVKNGESGTFRSLGTIAVS
ncbi:hypothetical protein AWC38_SpisGene24313 [Stylophora pistillata]|uniref:Uncharacterized protein n=1 Tax=Stylophora pistillata TaxID=50429 RepID=A0A2B4R2H5_STYPI|nr:hypothetical protein AWC38_SpisGene24313 [Stylophora pistillata]